MSRVGAAWRWLVAHPVKALLCSLGLVVVLRVAFLSMPFESDEGGYLMVARQWHGPGVSLYTDQWVDRPPLLLLFFKLAAWLGSDPVVVRLIGIGFALTGACAAWFAGRLVNGARGAVAACLVAAAIGSMYAIDGYALTGEGIAGALVMVSCAAALAAMHGAGPPPARLGLAALAGLTAATAVLTKQSFLDGLVFAAVLFLAAAPRHWRLVTAYAVGVAVPSVTTAAWALSDNGPGLSPLLVAMLRFRQRSIDVIGEAGLGAPLQRLRILLALFVVTGLAALAVQVVVAIRRAEGMRSLRFALGAWLAYDVVSIAAGASWWTHYLLQLTDVLALGAALATRMPSRPRLILLPSIYVTAASALSAVVGVVLMLTGHAKNANDEVVGDFLRDAGRPGDSVVVAYGAPSVIEQSGMPTPYRYSWSLPMRTRDPQLTKLVGVLSGPEAPTWLVEMGDFDWWGIDTPAFQRVRADDYHVVATVCGHDVYLHDAVERTLPPTPSC
jgi:hypothetical protein